MKRFLLWTLVFLALLLAADQALIRLPAEPPALAAVRDFYQDFRRRLVGLVDGGGDRSIEALIERAESSPARPPKPERPRSSAQAKPPASRAAAQPAPPSSSQPPQAPVTGPRYLYVDGQGDLQFADSLEEVPAAFRKDAQPLQK
ncbi:hypothetical protein DESUT3_40630 [Desulfuromonas versatilis]|uniref:Uncharacterized protein n=1 Tax=Desulfuromonas versatilis TaxID=2802975 RepID=A0ABM8I1Z0_9BACT|nr:hypothetical protein [Desulfuromonas versatilis]BCR06994.1 hypothetical protein DESUT3_40630 [Desulfuromonas versatilis]